MVKWAEKLTYGNFIGDWQERINVNRMREQKVARVRKIMRKYDIPTLLVSGEENVRYLTSVKCAQYDAMLRYVLFFAEHDPVLFEHAGYYHQYPDQAPWIKNWRIARCWLGGAGGIEATREEAALWASEIYDELKSRGLDKEKLGVIGIDGYGMAALEKLRLNLVPSRPLIYEARSVKNIDEINCEKMAAAIAEAAAYKMWSALKPGLRDTDLDIIVNSTAVQMGADRLLSMNVHTGPATFERGFYNTGRIIQTGDLVYMAICGGVGFLGYRTCIYRTFKVGGKPSDREKDWYKVLLDRVNTIIDAIKPGVSTADVAKYFPPASKWGYKDEAELLSIEYAHGLGLGGGYDQPVINRAWSFKHPQIFEPGNVMAVECIEGEHRVGGVRLENMFVVTENGTEIIDYLPRNEILLAPYGI